MCLASLFLFLTFVFFLCENSSRSAARVQKLVLYLSRRATEGLMSFDLSAVRRQGIMMWKVGRCSNGLFSFLQERTQEERKTCLPPSESFRPDYNSFSLLFYSRLFLLSSLLSISSVFSTNFSSSPFSLLLYSIILYSYYGLNPIACMQYNLRWNFSQPLPLKCRLGDVSKCFLACTALSPSLMVQVRMLSEKGLKLGVCLL